MSAPDMEADENGAHTGWWSTLGFDLLRLAAKTGHRLVGAELSIQAMTQVARERRGVRTSAS
jgi:hypothetical protein